MVAREPKERSVVYTSYGLFPWKYNLPACDPIILLIVTGNVNSFCNCKVAGSNRLLNPFFLSFMFLDRNANNPIIKNEEKKSIVSIPKGPLFCIWIKLKLTTSKKASG
jgi:hypothetical protein